PPRAGAGETGAWRPPTVTSGCPCTSAPGASASASAASPRSWTARASPAAPSAGRPAAPRNQNVGAGTSALFHDLHAERAHVEIDRPVLVRDRHARGVHAGDLVWQGHDVP